MKPLLDEKEIYPGPLVQVMLDGPYGGCSVDLGRFETVLLIAGGSGATFTLGLLDDIVGRCVKLGRRGGERTQRIEFAWCIRSFGAWRTQGLTFEPHLILDWPGVIKWFPLLVDIANTAAGSSLDVHISVFVTCLCAPEELPDIPNLRITLIRPSVHDILVDLVTPPRDADASVVDIENGDAQPISSCLKWVGLGGGVAVCASGPESMTREAHNAVARLSMSQGAELGGIAFHAEIFAL
jgi:ferric-chelate reductase